MMQILQHLGNGETQLAEVPCPRPGPGEVLIQTRRSLISIGTERMLIQFGQANLLEKARQQPDRVKQVLQKVKTDGLAPTLAAVRSKLEVPLPLGYCNAGVVVAVGRDVRELKVGDRVMSNGHHAEVVAVPENLACKIPDAVSDDDAAFVVVSAIALQGIRLANPTLGERIVVVGLGLIGLLTIQLLRANGCEVLGVDLDPRKLALAKELGADIVDISAQEDPLRAANVFSRGRGVDAVLITASTQSNEPVHQAAQMCRQRGRIVLVGVVGLELQRADFYEKELSFQVSCSYGPGRYDPRYEKEGLDYPIGFVRWTQNRNFEAVLDLLATGQLDFTSLKSASYTIQEALSAYARVTSDPSIIGVLLEYPDRGDDVLHQHILTDGLASTQSAKQLTQRLPNAGRIGVIGAGGFARSVLLPALQKAHADLRVICTRTGASAAQAAYRFRIPHSTTDTESVITNPNLDAVVVLTGHRSHAPLVIQALQSGKSVFVEKPLAINEEQLQQLETAYEASIDRGEQPMVMVGFNRRFSPHTAALRTQLQGRSEPLTAVMTVNAGALPPDHWLLDPKHGGRIIGEGCHFIDLLRTLVGHPITSINAMSVGRSQSRSATEDKCTFTLGFEDGSIGTVHYFANGHKGFPKERLEVFCEGSIYHLDNFRSLTSHGRRVRSPWGRGQDKGHRAEVQAFIDALKQGKTSPIPWNEVVEVTRVSIEVARQLQETRR